MYNVLYNVRIRFELKAQSYKKKIPNKYFNSIGKCNLLSVRALDSMLMCSVCSMWMWMFFCVHSAFIQNGRGLQFCVQTHGNGNGNWKPYIEANCSRSNAWLHKCLSMENRISNLQHTQKSAFSIIF